MNLKHAVITSVNRDDLEDGGAGIFAQTITETRRRSPHTEVEVLIPDFKGDREALQTVMDAQPEVLNHNTETVLRLQRDIRTSASYGRSLALLWRAKQMNRDGLTKSGLIVGMGETSDEVLATLADMRAVGIDIITIGQYLRPTSRHRPIHRYVHPDEFAGYKEFGEGSGIPHVESGPLVRSSYHAKESREAVPVSIGAAPGLTFDFPGRVRRLQSLMSQRGYDVALLSVGADLPYFTGYEAMSTERLTVLVLRQDRAPVLVVPELEAPRLTPGEFDVNAWNEIEDPVALAASVGGSHSSVLVGDHMWSTFLVKFQKEWPDASWSVASGVTSELRMRKDPDEIEALRSAAHGVDRVMARIPEEVVFGGRTEREVARRLSEMTVEEGHDVAKFAIVASGPNGASPHHEAGSRVIEQGDLVVCDLWWSMGRLLLGFDEDFRSWRAVGAPGRGPRCGVGLPTRPDVRPLLQGSHVRTSIELYGG